ncbi:protein phosphatase 2C family protein [Actinidia rufa]|uniref:Protein phosphatase 2C family protein n=1 Tax=Actinidia rufa TaxID=165716 RepID=A0A7J0E1N4_9ERIC|nr:protein phosphatase 2C family protein [Actinidia rufa]
MLDSVPYGIFVGIWDGHGGPETSRYINDHLFQHLKRKAPRLVKSAMQEAAKTREMRYSDLKKMDRVVRRHFHDDITVIRIL